MAAQLTPARGGRIRALAAGRALQLGIAVALFALVLWKSDAAAMGGVVSHANLRLLAAVVALDVAIALLFAFRSRLAMRRLGIDADAGFVFASAILGSVAGSLSPASSGELFRVAALSRAGASVEDGLALGLYERGLSALLLALGTCAAAAFVVLPLVAALAVAATAIGALALVPIAGALIPDRPAAYGDAGGGIVRRALARLRVAAGRLRWLLTDRGLLAGWSLLTVLSFAAAALQFWLLVAAVHGGRITFGQAWLAFGVSQLAGWPLPLGLGSSDGSLAALLRWCGVGLERGTAVAVLVRVTVMLPLGLMAVAAYVYLSRRSAVHGAEPGAAELSRAA